MKMADGCVFFRRNRPGTTAKVNKTFNFFKNLLFSSLILSFNDSSIIYNVLTEIFESVFNVSF